MGKSSSDIQAAECAYNLRVQDQVFAYFKIDDSKNDNNGAPYGTCYAYTVRQIIRLFFFPRQCLSNFHLNDSSLHHSSYRHSTLRLVCLVSWGR